jgi:hypothetical protein
VRIISPPSTRVPTNACGPPRRACGSPACAGALHSPYRRARAPRGHRPPGVARTPRSRPSGISRLVPRPRGEQAEVRPLGTEHPPRDILAAHEAKHLDHLVSRSSYRVKLLLQLSIRGYQHIVAFSPPGTYSTMAQTGVSGPVVVDGESFLDALFASAGQGWGTRQHRLQVEGRSRRRIDCMAASGLRRSRGHAQPADQRLPIVDLKAEMGSVVDARTISGACCTFP